MNSRKKKKSAGTGALHGFTLIEMLVGVAIFLIISTAIYQAYVGLIIFIGQNQHKILALNLANEQFEIARNLSYADLGVVASIPYGKIPNVQNLTRSGVLFTVTTTIRNIDLPFDGIFAGSPNDLSPADNKLVEVEIDCGACKDFTPVIFSSNVAPKNLETASTNGALFIKVFDANGLALSGASVHVENNQATSTITINDVTDVNGMLQIVDAPPGVEAYEITVTKSGYSTDKTYLTGASANPTPSKPHATVVLQQLTQLSFVIDRLSSLDIKSVTPTCTAVPSLNFSLKGSKIISQPSAVPSVLKYSQNLTTNGSGSLTLNSLEWDSYTLTGTDATYDIIGQNPPNLIGVYPASSGNISLIVAPKNGRSLLVTVKDSATLLPVTDAAVTLTNSSSYNQTETTGKGYINQTDWSGGGGQDVFLSNNQYASDNGNIDNNNPDGEIKLRNVFGDFTSPGELESSTIDTGLVSTFYNIIWQPGSQPPQTGAGSVRFQFATSPSSTPPLGWDFKGPDGTSATFYTTPNDSLASVHTGDQYARYKVLLATEDSAFTATISDIAFTFTSSCTPSGQVVFGALALGDYHLSVSKTGYSTAELDLSLTSSWQEQEVILTP